MMLQLKKIDERFETDPIINRQTKAFPAKGGSSERQLDDHFPDMQEKRILEYEMTINVLLKRLQEQRTELDKIVTDRITEIILPFLARLRETRMNADQKTLIDIICSNLKEMAIPSIKKNVSRHFCLTPMEIKVANLVKQGNRTKEIATILNCSQKTIDYHRTSIRRKLGIRNKQVNLGAFLLSV